MMDVLSSLCFAIRSMVRSVLISSMFFLLTTGCNEEVDQIRIRIRNTTDVSCTEVFVASGVPLLEGIFFGTVGPDLYSEYKTFPKAYGIAYIRFIAGGQERTLIPIDYVGKSPLKPGRYTYEIGLSGSGPNDVTFAFRKD